MPDYYTLYFLMILAMLFAGWAQINVKTTFSKYSRVSNAAGMTGFDAARKILDANGLYNIRIEQVAGELTDHYDPKAGVIRLSSGVYGSTSAAAIGVASHEAGHAVQHAVGYFPIKVRTAIIPICNIGSTLAWPLILLGIILSFPDLAMVGVAFFSLATVFQLVTLPVEFNASRRALAELSACGRFTQEELDGVRRVLSAAAMTYVAALFLSLMSFLRLLLIVAGNNRKGRR